MKKAWLLSLLLPLCLSGCQLQKSPPAEEYSRPFVENIKVENYYETGVNREYLSDVPQRVYKSLDAAEGDSGCCIVYSGGCSF